MNNELIQWRMAPAVSTQQYGCGRFIPVARSGAEWPGLWVATALPADH